MAASPGLNALIAQCRKLEAALRDEAGREDGAAPERERRAAATSTAMHRFIADMDARQTPPGLWSPLVLAVLTMVGGIGVGIGLLSLLLRPAGPALAAFALVLACAVTALALAIGVVAFMGGHAFGLVLLKRTALTLAASGTLGLIAWLQGDMRAVGPVVALLGGAGAWLLMNSNAFYVFAGYQMARRVMQAQARRR
ncbi:hypothetical protein [Achromobacter deleyi]|uniref:hypothetical protein n=1 Tax=Achromobacter deleyi TaxID=1353891 RepID=UPI00146824ED|nr:hypothetical protein [Achromobacter deleyi]CAB3916461.1 hypothetical protein LMG3412_05033 [Achromobacter deleyi]